MTADALTQFSFHLERLEPTDRQDVLTYFRLLDAVGKDAIVELAPRLVKSISSRDFRLLVTETSFYYPWSGWVEPLARLLRHESDLEVFESGTRSLANMGTEAASQTLKELYAIRHAPAFQEVLSEALILSDPEAAFLYHLGRLMEGSTNPQVANAAAVELVKVTNGSHLDIMKDLVRHPDILIARHALKLATRIGTEDSARFLIEHLQDLHQDALADREMKELLNEFKILPATGLKEMVFAQAQAHLEGTAVDMLASLETDPTDRRMEALRETASASHAGSFLAEAVCLVAEGKGSKLSTLVKDTTDAMHRRSRWIPSAIDGAAEGLLQAVGTRLITREEVVEVLSVAYEKLTGREGVGRVLGTLVEPEDRAVLDLILAGLDSTVRAAALDAIGARRLDAMLDFLLRASRDPIVDIAERAIAYLGKLSRALDATLALLRSQDLAEVRLGVRILAINRMAEGVPRLLEILSASTREDFALEAYEALGRIGTPEALAALLEALHSGQSQRMQLAIATALKDTADSQAIRGLADRAASLRNAQIHALAAEGLMLPCQDPAHPLPQDDIPLLKAQILPCWEDKDPWPLRNRLIPLMAALHCGSPDFCEELAALIGALLADKRNLSVWNSLQQTAAQTAVRQLELRAKALRG